MIQINGEELKFHKLLINKANRLVVEITINENPLWFLVDTGCPSNIIDEKLYTIVTGKEVPQPDMNLCAPFSKMVNKKCSNDLIDVEINDETFKIGFFIADVATDINGNMKFGVPIAGLLGVGFLSYTKATIQF